MACNDLTHTLSFSNNTPVIGETVTCTATVTNNGSTTEQFHVVFAQSGLSPFSTSEVMTIAPGATVTVTGAFQGTIATTVNICADLVCDTGVYQFFPSDYFWNVRCNHLPVASNNTTIINYLNSAPGGDGGTSIARLGLYEAYRPNFVTSATPRKYLTYFNEDNNTAMGFETWKYQDYTSQFPVPPNAICQPNYPAYTVKSVTDSTHFKDTSLHCAAGNYVVVEGRGGSLVNSVNGTTFEVTLTTSIPGMMASDPYTVVPGQIMGTLSENSYTMIDTSANMMWVIYDGRLNYRVADHMYSPTLINGRLIPAPGEMACKISVTENLSSYTLKPVGTYGISMSGLNPIPGYIRKSELDAGVIRHALYGTGYHLGNNATRIYPARTSSDAWSGVVPCGTRLRLKSTSATAAKVEAYTGYKRTILRCLQEYGCFMLDNDRPHKVGLVLENGIGLNGLDKFPTILPTDFEAVDMTSMIINENSGQMKGGTF